MRPISRSLQVAAGRFREDLYFRLAVIPIQLPPLRARREDVLPLARHFLQKWSRELARPMQGWTPEVEDWLGRHDWPGNVRELENTIERGVVLARSDRIGLEDLLLEPRTTEPASGEGLQDVLDRAAADHIRKILHETGQRKQEAARRLGVDRTTLYRLLRKYGLA